MISVFLIAVTSADGYIAKDEKHVSTSWTSQEDKKHFTELTKRAGVVVMGSKTYETFMRPLKDRRTIVYSRTKKYDGVEMTSETPKDLVARLEKEGCKEVAITGGAHIYTMFLESGLVDTIYLTIEGVLFGKGIPLFNANMDISLNLVKNTQLGPNTVLLEYSINK
jgi:dihydrofolate reductase